MKAPRLFLRAGRTATRATPKGAFAVATRAMPGRRTHLVARAITLWDFGRFDGFMASTRCGRRLVSVSLHLEAPDEFELCDDCALHDFSGHCVYRLFAADGRLLYIGCTGNLWARVASHSGTSAFWPQVARITYESHSDRPAALAADQPPFNLEHTERGQRGARRRVPALQHLAVAA